MRFGSVSAGHGEKYKRAMENLFKGARVWAAIPKSGYVGVGTVTAEAVGVKDFDVEIDGNSQAPRGARPKGDEYGLGGR